MIASHDITLIDKLGCRRIELDDGRLVGPEEGEAVLEAPATEFVVSEQDRWR